MTTRNVINILYANHADIREKIVIAKEALKILETNVLRDKIDDIIIFFNTHLLNHFKHEEVVFAVAKKHHAMTRREHQLLQDIMTEHTHLLKAYADFLAIARNGSTQKGDCIAVFYDILDTLIKHAEKEDAQVYPMLQKYLNQAQLEEAFQTIQQMD